MPSVVTANHLRSGAVVYLSGDGHWGYSLVDAALASTADELKHLEAQALTAVERNEVTAVYAFDVRTLNGTIEPVSVREHIRATQATTI